jgi:Peptidase family M1 domain
MSAKRYLSLRLLIAALLSLPVAASAAPDPAYTAIRNARLDGRSVPVNNLVLERDVYRFQFDSGAFHFLAPVQGRTWGAVFVGKGSYRLSPAKESERRQLALSSGADPKTFETLTDEFDQLVLLFADDTAKEIEIHAPVQTGSPDARAASAYEVYLKRQKKDYRTNFHLRVLQDLLNQPNLTSGVFMAFIDGKKYPPALAAVDPNGAEALRVGFRLGGEDTLFVVFDPNRGGSWYHCDQKGEVDRKRAIPEKVLTDALDYTIETSIERDEDLAGTTVLRFQPLVPNLRLLPVFLTENLRVQEASYALETAGAEPEWKPVAFVQEEKKEDSDLAVIFPEPLAKGATVRLKISYKGDKVLRDGGDKNYYVRARESWYPNVGIFSDQAMFDLTYRVPVGNEIISVGRQLETRDEGAQSVSHWKTEHPVQVAGFNYGKFKKFEKTDEISKLSVEVYTNPGTPDIIREINSAMRNDEFQSASWEGFETDNAAPNESLGTMNTAKLAEAAITDGINSARLFTAYFGKLPQSHVAITQQSDFGFGQSWPSLIFLPYISFMDGTQRQRLGMGAGAKDFVDAVTPHEFAHQWWGHRVGAATYRDQWMEEGFSEFSAALVLQHTRNWGAYDRFWSERRKEILNVFPGNATGAWEAGPVTQGYRVSTPRNPAAYRFLAYPKGGYILHMLRMMMYDPTSQDPDAKFKEMMWDFTSTYGGKFASTADFQKIVEKHMVPAMNATGDGKMDWFFNQWVYGYEVPRYVSDLKIKTSGDEAHITGTVRQEGVSKDFRALVPIYVELSKTETARVHQVPLVGESSVQVDLTVKLPKKPRRALVNARGEILARD